MVDVGHKLPTQRTARASARLRMNAETLNMIRGRTHAKGDVLEVSRLAAIMAAKRTAQLIPLCHPLPIESVEVEFQELDDRTIGIVATVGITAKMGVEMEALVAVSTAALTVYDMCKSVDRGIVVERIQLEEKAGGKSGTWIRRG